MKHMYVGVCVCVCMVVSYSPLVPSRSVCRTHTLVLLGHTLMLLWHTLAFLGHILVFLGHTIVFFGTHISFFGHTLVFSGHTLGGTDVWSIRFEYIKVINNIFLLLHAHSQCRPIA